MASDDKQVYSSSNIDNDDCFDFSFLFGDDEYGQSTLPPTMNNNDDQQVVYTTNIDNSDDCFLEKIFADDDYYDHQSTTLPPTVNNNYMMTTSHHREDPIPETNYSMPFLNVVCPDPPAEEIVVGSNNKRKRSVQEEVVVSPPPKCLFKAVPKTLENPNHLFHQETALLSSTISPSSNPWSSYATQPYIANNNVISHDELIMKKAIFSGSRRKTPSPWTFEEHVRFLIGMAKGHRGNWQTISRDYVKTRTAAQVTSHAQKHFLHQHKIANPSMMMRRRSCRSLYDIVSLSQVEVSKVADALRYVRSFSTQ